MTELIEITVSSECILALDILGSFWDLDTHDQVIRKLAEDWAIRNKIVKVQK